MNQELSHRQSQSVWENNSESNQESNFDRVDGTPWSSHFESLKSAEQSVRVYVNENIQEMEEIPPEELEKELELLTYVTTYMDNCHKIH